MGRKHAIFSLCAGLLLLSVAAAEEACLIVTAPGEVEIKEDGKQVATIYTGLAVDVVTEEATRYRVRRLDVTGWIDKSAVMPPERAITYFTKAIESKPTPVAYFGRGMAYYWSNDFDKALADSSAALRLKPDDFDARNLRAFCYSAKRDADHVIVDRTELIRLKPDYDDSYFERGTAYLQKGDFEKAIADATEAIRRAPRYAEAYVLRAAAYNQKGDGTKAVSDCNEALACSKDTATETSIHRQRAYGYMLSGARDKAINEYQTIIKREPKDAESYFFLGYVYDETGNFQKAIETYTKAIELDRQAQYLSYRAVSYWRCGDIDKAIRDYDEAIQRSPRNAALYHSRGVCRFNKQLWDDAISDYTTAITIDPNHGSPISDRGSESVYLNRGLAYFEKAEYDKAIADFNEAVRRAPRYADAYINRAAAYNRKGDGTKAVSDCNEALACSKDTATETSIYQQRAYGYMLSGARDKAIDDYLIVIKRDPKDADSHFFLGYVYSESGDIQHAIKYYTKAIELNPIANYYSRRAEAYEKSNDPDKALADYTEAIRLAPKDLQLRLARITILNSQGEYGKAIDDYSVAIELSPKDSTLYDGRGRLYWVTGNLGKANEDFTKAIELDPKSGELLSTRGAFYAHNRKFDQAIQDLSEAIRLAPNSPSAYDNRGSVYFRLGRFGEAIDDYTAAIRLGDLQAYYRRADAYKKIGKLAEAEEDIATATKNGVLQWP